MKHFLLLFFLLSPALSQAQIITGTGGGIATSIVVGGTTITGSCTNGYALYDNNGVLGCQNGSTASSIVPGTTVVTGCTNGVLFATGSSILGCNSALTTDGLGDLSIASGTITASQKGLNITQTWNNAGTTFDAPLFVNITNTASTTASLLTDLQVGGSSVWSLSAVGNVVLNGAGNNSVTVNAATGDTASLFLGAAGTNYAQIKANSGGFSMAGLNGAPVFISATGINVTQFVGTSVSAVNYLQIRNSVSGQPVEISSYGGNGGDTNVDLVVNSYGAGKIRFSTQGASITDQFVVLNTSSANVQLTATGGNNANPVLATTGQGLTIAPSNGTTAITGTVTVSAIASNTGAQTGYLCYNTSGGVITYDGTNTCLVSSARYKTNIRPLDPDVALAEVMRLKPSSFNRTLGDDRTERLGLIAEEVADVDDRMIVRDGDGLPRGVLYETGGVALLTSAFQALKGELDEYRRTHP